MQTTRRLLTAITALLLTGCTSMHTTPSPEVRQTLAPTGKLRVGVYAGSPFSMIRDPLSGETKGITVEIGKALADRLDVPYEQVEFPRIAEVLEALKAGKVDMALANASPARANDFEWTPPVLLIELGYLVLPGSPVTTITDVDRPGIRVGVTEGGTTHRELAHALKFAKVVPAATLNAAIEMLSQHSIDTYTTNKANLYQMSDRLPGSRVLDGRWGIEHLSLAIPKGRGEGMAYVGAFVEEARAEGLISRAAQRAGLRGAVDAK
jgi:polar amino acid transport system substrate-binding protein